MAVDSQGATPPASAPAPQPQQQQPTQPQQPQHGEAAPAFTGVIPSVSAASPAGAGGHTPEVARKLEVQAKERKAAGAEEESKMDEEKEAAPSPQKSPNKLRVKRPKGMPSFKFFPALDIMAIRIGASGWGNQGIRGAFIDGEHPSRRPLSHPSRPLNTLPSPSLPPPSDGGAAVRHAPQG